MYILILLSISLVCFLVLSSSNTVNNNSFIIILPPSLPVDDVGEAEDEETGGGEGEREVVEDAGPGLHQVTHQHREQFPPQQG